jgi:hypothetical protein
VVGRVGLWSLQRHTEGTVPAELREDTKGTGDTKENGVVVLFNETIVLEEDTRVGIYVGPWVLGLTVLGQDTGNDVVQLADETEERIVGQVLESELTLSHVTGISLTENGMAETGNNLTTLQGSPDVVLDSLFISMDTNLILHLESPTQDFLVGKTVKRSSKTVETGSEREIGIGESRADQVSTTLKKKIVLLIFCPQNFCPGLNVVEAQQLLYCNPTR